MLRKKKYKKRKTIFCLEILCITIVSFICLSFIMIIVLNNAVSKNQQKESKKEKKIVNEKEKNAENINKDSYYKLQINADIPEKYKDNFIDACSSCDVDIESISDFKKAENWEYGEIYSFIYNGVNYTANLSNSGEVVSIIDSTPEKIYENKNAQLIKDESEEQSQEQEAREGTGEIEENKENIYNPDDNIEKLITEYNQISEFKIGENNIRQGAYDFNACASCNGVWIMIYDSSKMYIDFSIDANDDSRIYPVFRDFCKTLNKNLSDDEIFAGWSELQTGRHGAYNYFYIGGIQCSYTGFRPEIGALTQYTVKIGNEY